MTALETMNKEAVEYIRGIPVVKVFQQTVYSFKNFHAAIEEYEKYASGYALKCRIPLTGFQVALNSTFILLIPVAGLILAGVSGQAAYEDVLLDFLFYSLFTPICTTMMNRVMFAGEQLMAAKSAVNRIEEVLKEQPLAEPVNPKQPQDASVVFEDVTFCYPDTGEKALAHISFELPAGKTVALVGASGSGKSTAAKLIPRFYDVTEGSVRVGGVDVREIDKQTLMGQIAFVFQNTRLFKDTLLENIRAARPQASREEVLTAVKAAQCGEIIDRLPQGIDTVVGNGGTYLSGGENQRVSLARAVLKDAPIVILDEATAFADAENEHQIQLAFEQLTEGKTVLMIAHRLSTIQNAALILVFDQGTIVERGTHEKLLGEGSSEGQLWMYVIVGIVIIAVIFIMHYLQYTVTYMGTYEESERRRITLAEKLRTLPLRFFKERDLSDLTSTIMGDCSGFEHAFSHTVPQFWGSLLSTALVCIALLVYDWRMGLALLWVAPAAFAIVLLSRKLQERQGQKHMAAKLALADGIQECLETVADIKACNQEAQYLKKLDEKMDRVERAQISSELFAVNLQVNRLKEIQDYKEETKATSYRTNGYDITFDHVSFAYEPGKPVLKDVSFTAKQGQVTALVGPSGGGKSTVANLAAGFYDVTGGKITLGGTDIAPIDSVAMMKDFSVVFQDVVLFNNTIMENIRVGRKNATDEEVVAAAKAAHCHDFIIRLPEGYQTVLVIAHRMRTVENADQIVVLDGGIVAERGTHEQLMSRDGLYARLVKLQTASAEWKLNG